MKYFVAKDEKLRLEATTRAGLRGSFVALSDGITHYELRGPQGGALVVLVGGLTIPLFYWDRAAALLHERGMRTLAYSSYGRGYSDRIRTRYDDALFVRQLSDLIAALYLPGPHHVVGSSMGALVAMDYVISHAPAVATLTVAGPAGLAPRPAALRWLLSGDRRAAFVARHFGRRWLRAHESHNLGDTTHAAELSAMLRDAYRYEGSLHALFDTLQHFGLFDRAGLYRRTGDLGVPTLLLWGRDDQVTPIDKIDAACALLRPDHREILDCGHMTPFERSREVTDLIVAFASAHRDGSIS